MIKCYNCGATEIERCEVTWPVTIGGHEVTHTLTEDVCANCGEWSIHAETLGRLELLTAQQVLGEHPMTGSIAKDIRKALGLKQTELGEKLGVAPETISRWERGEYRMEPWVGWALKGLVSAALGDSLDRAIASESERNGWKVVSPRGTVMGEFASQSEATAYAKELDINFVARPVVKGVPTRLTTKLKA